MADPTGNGDGDWRFDDLRALYINCTLKRSPDRSHTQGLIDRSRSIMERHGSPSPSCGPSITTSPPACGRT
jgi:hypothetical protein